MIFDIAVVGLSFKGPQEADNASGLWDILEKGKNLMTEWPKSRVNLGSFYAQGPDNSNMVSTL